MSWFMFELIGLAVGGVAWLIMWLLDVGGSTFQIANGYVSVRLAIAVVIGIVASLIISAALKRKGKASEQNFQ